MKDHEIRELVNQLRDVAIKYHGAGQLREQIARTVRAAIIQAQSDDDGEPTDDERIMAIEGIHNCERCSDEGWVVGEMGITRCACGQAGNSPAHTGLRPEQSNDSPAHAPSREHFISLCNEFWNWSEMDLVCADDSGYELRMEWGGDVFKHPVTQALWRMYQAAPGNSPVIGIDLATGADRTVEVRYVAPPGYVMVPKEPTKEMIDAGWLHFMGTKNPSSKGTYKAMLAAAQQEAK